MPGRDAPATRTAVDLAPSLRRLVMADAPHDDDATAALWHRYLAGRSAADESALFDHYAPLMWMRTRRVVGRGGTPLFPDPLADYLSDAAMGLLLFIRKATAFHPGQMFVRAGMTIRRTIWRAARERTWEGNGRTENRRTVERVRDRLADQLGRQPDRREVVAELFATLTNPNVYVYAVDHGVERTMTADSQLGEHDSGPGLAEPVDPSAVEPIVGLLAAETVELAMKPLAGPKRDVLGVLLDGRHGTDGAATLGLSKPTYARRVNAVRWSLATDAAVAAHVGFAPVPVPERTNNWQLPWFGTEAQRRAAV